MIDGTVQCDGLWWPLADTEAREVILRDVDRDVRAVLEHTTGRDVIVQAGSNVGVYPLALADHFQAVVTFEPHPVNWECLVQNLQARDSLRRVTAWCAALGEGRGYCDVVEKDRANCGAHYVAYDRGQTPVMTIDDLCLQACDAIWLDLEGSELHALKGGADTIRRFAPTIVVEDKGLDRDHFAAELGALQKWIDTFGYAQVAAFGRDKIFRRIK